MTSPTTPKPPKVVFYLLDLAGGGVERMSLTLAAELGRRGVEVSLVLNVKRGPLLDLVPPGIAVVELGADRTLAALWPLMRYLRRTRPDVLISGLDHLNVAAALAAALSLSRVRVIIGQHNALSHEVARSGWKYRALPRLYRLVFPLVSGVIAVSRGVAEDLVRMAAIPAGAVTVIYNPVIDIDFARRAAEPALHPWLGKGRLEPVFVAAGRLGPQKDFATLLRGFAAFLDGGGQARLIVLGTGPERDQLVELARWYDIASRVDFAGFQSNPLPIMREAAALVMTSRYEGFGNVLVEAMGCGTPVIATDCEFGPSEILEGGVYGHLVPVGDAAALARAMSAVLAAPRDSERLKARAAQFTVAIAGGQYLETIERAMRASPGQPQTA